MKKLILSAVFTLTVFTSCLSKKDSSKTDNQTSIDYAAINYSKNLIDSVFNLKEVTPDYLSIKVDSIQIEKIIEIKSKNLNILKENKVSRFIDSEYIDSYSKYLNEEINPEDPLVCYLLFMKIKLKCEVKNEYKDILTENQKEDIQKYIKDFEEYKYIPNILTPDKKQLNPSELKNFIL